MRGFHPQNEGTNNLKPFNLYYDENTNILVQGGQVTQSPRQMGPSTSQDVRFMNASIIFGNFRGVYQWSRSVSSTC